MHPAIRSRSACPTPPATGDAQITGIELGNARQVLLLAAKTGIRVVAQVQTLRADAVGTQLADQIIAPFGQQGIHPVAGNSPGSLPQQTNSVDVLQRRFVIAAVFVVTRDYFFGMAQPFGAQRSGDLVHGEVEARNQNVQTGIEIAVG